MFTRLSVGVAALQLPLIQMAPTWFVFRNVTNRSITDNDLKDNFFVFFVKDDISIHFMSVFLFSLMCLRKFTFLCQVSCALCESMG